MILFPPISFDQKEPTFLPLVPFRNLKIVTLKAKTNCLFISINLQNFVIFLYYFAATLKCRKSVTPPTLQSLVTRDLVSDNCSISFFVEMTGRTMYELTSFTCLCCFWLIEDLLLCCVLFAIFSRSRKSCVTFLLYSRVHIWRLFPLRAGPNFIDTGKTLKLSYWSRFFVCKVQNGMVVAAHSIHSANMKRWLRWDHGSLKFKNAFREGFVSEVHKFIQHEESSSLIFRIQVLRSQRSWLTSPTF